MVLVVIVTVVSQTAPALAASAVSSSKAMHEFWCNGTPPRESLMCKVHSLTSQLAQTSDTDAKKKVSDDIKKLMAANRVMNPAIPVAGKPPSSPFAKEYSAMKMAFCATKPSNAKTLCSTAGTQYKSGGSSSIRPSTTPTPAVSSLTEVSTWYCAKPVHEEDFCKRTEIMAKLRATTDSEARKQLMTELKAYPAPDYSKSQAIYADYCKIAKNADSSTCLRIKQTQGAKLMQTWYCALPSSANSLWCKRQSLIAKLQKIPISTTDTAMAAERKEISRQYSDLLKPKEGSVKEVGSSTSSQIGKEIVEAKKAYCALDDNKRSPYCKPPEAFGAKKPPPAPVS
eukprot:CAMPEP_0119318080 /NCGR_PEP_ID=MMETSP1333-20130426/45368_1 /TAXON_ID=418940 /ORGANISM="Scyphosphaera apsteinii, Strain RCC1455" /LENGTH=340 /DNA_ID=CAMNT_0007324183 /DNA_START=66 /DNA_END=1088 /DNA_ORIENTATION=-